MSSLARVKDGRIKVARVKMDKVSLNLRKGSLRLKNNDKDIVNDKVNAVTPQVASGGDKKAHTISTWVIVNISEGNVVTRVSSNVLPILHPLAT